MKKMITRGMTFFLVMVLFVSTFGITVSAAATEATKEQLAKTPILNSITADKTKIGFGDRINFIINATDQSGKGLKKAYLSLNTYDSKGNPIAYFGNTDEYRTQKDKLGDFVFYYVHQDQTGTDSTFPTSGSVEIVHFFIEDNEGNISNYMGNEKKPMTEYGTVEFPFEISMQHKVLIEGKTLSSSEKTAASKVSTGVSAFQTMTTNKTKTPVKTPAKTPATTSGKTPATTPAKTPATTPAKTLATTKNTITTANKTTTTVKETTTTVKETNVKTISATELAGVVKNSRAKGLKTSLMLYTVQNEKIETRVVINAETIKEDFAGTAYTTGDTVTALQEKFAEYYKNEMVIVDFTQKEKVVDTARISVKSSIKDAKGLVCYRYDKATGKAAVLKDAKISVDKNGYINVTAAPHGVLIISKGALSK